MKALTSQQRKYLRGLAHSHKPLVLVGGDGITDGVVGAVDQALLDHELIKVRMHEPEDKKGMAADLAERTKSTLCGLIGHTAVLYKQHPENPTLHLPAASGK